LHRFQNLPRWPVVFGQGRAYCLRHENRSLLSCLRDAAVAYWRGSLDLYSLKDILATFSCDLASHATKWCFPRIVSRLLLRGRWALFQLSSFSVAFWSGKDSFEIPERSSPKREYCPQPASWRLQTRAPLSHCDDGRLTGKWVELVLVCSFHELRQRLRDPEPENVGVHGNYTSLVTLRYLQFPMTSGSCKRYLRAFRLAGPRQSSQPLCLLESFALPGNVLRYR
jgi:hypothetical protein